jgi:hypothetical protein
MASPSSRRVMPGERLSTQCQPAGRAGNSSAQIEMDVSDIAAKRAEIREKRAAELDVICSRWFAAALDAWGKDENYADEIGVAKNIVSDMRNGKRVVKLRDCLPLLESPDSAKVLLGGLAELAGFAAPIRKRTVTRAEVDAKTAALVRRTIVLWKAIRREVAEELGADVEQVELALEAAE